MNANIIHKEAIFLIELSIAFMATFMIWRGWDFSHFQFCDILTTLNYVLMDSFCPCLDSKKNQT